MLKRKIEWKWVIVISIIFFMFLTFALPQVSNYSTKIIGETESPDTSLIYSGEDLYHMAESYGETGRRAYIKLRWTFDVIWPIVYTLFLVSWIMKLSEYLSINKFTRYIFVIPIIGMAFDFLENIGATIIMMRYPLKMGLIAIITPVMTLLKWIILAESFLMMIVLIVLIIINKIRDSKGYK